VRAVLTHVDGRAWARGAALCVILALGCDMAEPPASAIPNVTPSPPTQLEHVMRRLEDALQHARAAASSGVVSIRQSRYELIEPSAEDDRYTARVVIQTTVGLRGGPQMRPIGDAAAATGDAEAPGEEVTKRIFKLVYKDQRWELLEPPVDELTDIEKLCFQSALSDG
jgi:hypothetical protein